MPPLFGAGNWIFLKAVPTHSSTFLFFAVLLSTLTTFTAPVGPSVAWTVTVALNAVDLPPAPMV
jgi:hypothetical protein